MTSNRNSSMQYLKIIWPRSVVGLMLLFASLSLTSLAHASTLLGEVFRASDSAPNNAYGFSVSISGETAAIGAWFGSGAVYIMNLDPVTNTWQETQKIETPESAVGRLNFGFSVSLDGDQLVVGAPNILNQFPGALVGAAYIYQRDTTSGTWQLASSIEGRVAELSDSQGIGRDVAVDRGVAAISRLDGETEVVLTYVQDPSNGSWTQSDTFEFVQSESPGVDIVSTNVNALALDNNRLAVSFETEDSNGLTEFRIRLFDYNRELDVWVESDTLDEEDGLVVSENFRGLAMDNDQLLVTGRSGESPILFLFNRETAVWSPDADFSVDFASVGTDQRLIPALDGSRLVLQGASGGGTVYERNGGNGRWEEVFQLSTALLSGADISSLGGPGISVTSVDLEGDHVMVGTPYIDQFTGALIAYRLDDPDADGVLAGDDNCPVDFNPTQDNFDDDLLGDVCDLDDDNDGVVDTDDGFPFDPDRLDAPVSNGSGEAPSAPQPSQPFGSGIALEADFRWPVVSDATYYVIEVQHNGEIRAYEPFIAANTACFNGQCGYVKSDAARDGANRWRLRAGNDAGVSPWSPWVDFFVGQAIGAGSNPGNSAAFNQLPVVPVLQLPSGDSSNAVSDYVWSAAPGVVEYAIEVQHQGSIRAYEPSLAASEACVSGQCRYTKSDAALIGENRWRVRAINNVGSSAWSEWINFSVSSVVSDPTAPSNAIVPAIPVPFSPVSQQSAQVADYVWGEVAGATMYAVEVQHAGTIRGYNNNLLAAESCSGGECIYSKPDAALSGENRWRVRAGNSNGFSAWSDWQNFTTP